MASKKITDMPAWGGGQVPTDLLTGVDLSQSAANQNVKTTLNDLFSIITKNITDGAVRWSGFAAPPLSAADAGAIYFSSADDIFYASENGAAYVPLIVKPAGTGTELQYRAGPATFGAVTGSSVLGGAITLADIATIQKDDAVTNASVVLLDLQHSSTGTPAANFGGEIRFGLESNTTINRFAGALRYSWEIVTDATRSGRADIVLHNQVYGAQSLRLEVIKEGASGISIGAPNANLYLWGQGPSGGSSIHLLPNYLRMGWNSSLFFYNNSSYTGNPVVQMNNNRVGIGIGAADTLPTGQLQVISLHSSIPAIQVDVNTTNKRGIYINSTNALAADTTSLFTVSNNGTAFVYCGLDAGISASTYVSIGERVYIGRRGGGSGVSDNALQNASYEGIDITPANNNGGWLTLGGVIRARSGIHFGWCNNAGTSSGQALDTSICRAAVGITRFANGSTGAGKIIVGPSTALTTLADAYIVGSSASLVPFVIDGASLATAALAKFRDNTTELYEFELAQLKITKGTAFNVWINTNAGAKSSFRVGATSGLHPGNAYGLILPYIGGSNSDGPGIYWTDGTYGSTFRINLNLGLNIQGAGGVHPVRIRRATDSNADGDVIFDFRPNDGNFALLPYTASNTTEIHFRELATNGSNYVGFKAPSSIANDTIWILPNADGIADSVLTTNGSKVLSFATPAVPYGELYEDGGSTAITIATAGTYVQWTTSTLGSLSKVSGSTLNDNLSPDSGYGGTYFISLWSSFTATANATVSMAIFVNGSRSVDGTVTRKVSSGGDVGAAACSCIAAVAAGQTVDARFTSSSNGDTVTPSQLTLTMIRIGS